MAYFKWVFAPVASSLKLSSCSIFFNFRKTKNPINQKFNQNEFAFNAIELAPKRFLSIWFLFRRKNCRYFRRNNLNSQWRSWKYSKMFYFLCSQLGVDVRTLSDPNVNWMPKKLLRSKNGADRTCRWAKLAIKKKHDRKHNTFKHSHERSHIPADAKCLPLIFSYY